MKAGVAGGCIRLGADGGTPCGMAWGTGAITKNRINFKFPESPTKQR